MWPTRPRAARSQPRAVQHGTERAALGFFSPTPLSQPPRPPLLSPSSPRLPLPPPLSPNIASTAAASASPSFFPAPLSLLRSHPVARSRPERHRRRLPFPFLPSFPCPSSATSIASVAVIPTPSPSSPALPPTESDPRPSFFLHEPRRRRLLPSTLASTDADLPSPSPASSIASTTFSRPILIDLPAAALTPLYPSLPPLLSPTTRHCFPSTIPSPSS